MTCEHCHTILSNKEVEEVEKAKEKVCCYCDKPLRKEE